MNCVKGCSTPLKPAGFPHGKGFYWCPKCGLVQDKWGKTPGDYLSPYTPTPEELENGRRALERLEGEER